MSNVYLLGNVVRLHGTFKNSSGANTDPTAVVFKVKKPDRTVDEVSAIKSTTGVYYGDYTPTQTGAHTYYISGSGSIVAADHEQFIVDGIWAKPR